MRVFLLASFPSLSLQAPAPISFSRFLTRCEQHLGPKEMEEMDALCTFPPGGASPFAAAWRQAWGEVRNYNDRERAKRLPPGTLEHLPPDLPYVNDRLRANTRAAWEAPDPLKREQLLLHAQWVWLDFIRIRSPWTLDDLFAYALQLKLLQQRDAWDEEQGAVQFEEQTKTFMSPLLDQLFPKANPA